MSKGYSVRVRIGGRAFGIISDEKPDYLTDVAQEVDKSISGMLAANPDMTFERAAVLAALKFCDDARKSELLKYSDKNNDEDDNLRQQVMQYAKELSSITQKYKQLEKELDSVKKDYEDKISEIKMNYQAREIQFREYIKKIKPDN